MKILITGGSGYIGTALAPLLKGHEIIIADKLAPMYSDTNTKYIEQDFTNSVWHKELTDAIEKSDIVIHLLATFSKDAEISKQINYNVTTRLYNQCIEKGNLDRFIFVSTCGVNNPEDKSEYTAYKSIAEEYIRETRYPNAPWVIARLASVFGKSERMSYEPLINSLVKDAKTTKRIEIFGANEYRPFIHIDTAANAISKLTWLPISHVAFQTFDMATENCTKLELANTIKKYLPSVEIISRNSNNTGYVISKRTLSSLNIRLFKSIDDGVKEMSNAAIL